MVHRVMAIDPGLTRCGIAVVDADTSRKVRLVDVRIVRTPTEHEIGERLAALEAAIIEAIKERRPNSVAIEQVFSQHNIRTVIGTAQAAGVAALVAHRSGLPISFHTPSEVKAAVTGSGTAAKAQVASMVGRIVGQPVVGPADATDAIALAICHAWRWPALQLQRAPKVVAS